MHIRKLVLPVAGMGKRLQPLTLTTPKNLVKLNGKPLIEYALEEAKVAGIEEVAIVISPEHEAKYEKYLASASAKFPEFQFHIRVQERPWGDGHAVLQAADVVGHDPFAVRFCDDVIVSEEPSLAKLIANYNRTGASVILLERVPMEDVTRYGVVRAEQAGDEIYRIWDVVEKPKLEEAPSNLIVIGGYALGPEVMTCLQEMQRTMDEENDALRISHALRTMLRKDMPLFGWEFPGRRLDCGTLEGLSRAEEFIAARGAVLHSNIPAK